MIETFLGEYSFVAGGGTNIRYYMPGEIIPDKEQNPYYLAGKRKPLPNTEEFTYQYFKSLLEGVSGALSMKAFRATEQRIPGLGNGVLQEILLEAGLHPKHKIGGLTEEHRRRVYESIVGILEKMTLAGGRDTEKDLFGNKGGYQTLLSKRTAGKPCPYCANLIQKANYMGGTVYFCPLCQELC